jgi:hypothetical protein
MALIDRGLNIHRLAQAIGLLLWRSGSNPNAGLYQTAPATRGTVFIPAFWQLIPSNPDARHMSHGVPSIIGHTDATFAHDRALVPELNSARPN